MADDRRGKIMKGASIDSWKAYRRFYRDKVRLFDERLGGVLAALRERGLLESTLVVVTSDHGDMDAAHRLVFKGPFMYDEVVRVPGGHCMHREHPEPFVRELLRVLVPFA
jgi:arylsulfatase A-like enzyme